MSIIFLDSKQSTAHIFLGETMENPHCLAFALCLRGLSGLASPGAIWLHQCFLTQGFAWEALFGLAFGNCNQPCTSYLCLCGPLKKKKKSYRSGEMTQQIRVSVALPEDLGLSPQDPHGRSKLL